MITSSVCTYCFGFICAIPLGTHTVKGADDVLVNCEEELFVMDVLKKSWDS